MPVINAGDTGAGNAYTVQVSCLGGHGGGGGGGSELRGGG
jgi:hypothetical protein